MTAKKLKSTVLAGVCGTVFLCTAALGEGDSLVSLSDLNQSFLPQVTQQTQLIQEQYLQEIFDQAVQQAQQVAANAANNNNLPVGFYSSSLAPRALEAGSVVTLETGSSFLLASGAGVVRHDGAVVDVTSGTTVSSNGSLTTGHRYIVAENTLAEFTMTAPSSVGFEGSYLLEIGDGTVTLPSEPNTPDPPNPPVEVNLPFTDVKTTDWYYSAVAYAYQNGLFAGMDDTTFAPNLSMDRAMLVTVLYHLAGYPIDEFEDARASFTDVRDKDWFAPYVRWAASQGITAGTGDGKFSPNQKVTRQQMLVFLYNFGTNYMGLPLTEWADLSHYADASKVDDWGLIPMQWSIGSGVFASASPGKTTLDPQADASRAQVALMLQNFSEKYLANR